MNPPQADDVRVGSVLGGTYELTSLLGEGGMGYVFAARHLRLPKQVAVKVLKTGFSLSPDIVARFRREAEIASRLGHPHIVEVLDFDTLPGGTPFLVLEFLKGESLGQRIARGPLSWEETREVALQAGSALLAAHSAGVVHRDLKPDNIFLLPGDSAGSARHRVKLLDFGISKLSGGNTVQTQDSVLMGTPRYMSPEQALGKNAAIDARSDVFALACIYYEMLAGQPAFAGDNIPTLLYKIVHEMPEPLGGRAPGLPPHVWPALERALAKDVEARTPDVVTLTEALTGTRLFIRAEAPRPVPPEGTDPSTLELLGATYVPPGPTPPPGAGAGPVDVLGATHTPGSADPLLAATHVPAAPGGGARPGGTLPYGAAPTAALDATFVPGPVAATPATGTGGDTAVPRAISPPSTAASPSPAPGGVSGQGDAPATSTHTAGAAPPTGVPPTPSTAATPALVPGTSHAPASGAAPAPAAAPVPAPGTSQAPASGAAPAPVTPAPAAAPGRTGALLGGAALLLLVAGVLLFRSPQAPPAPPSPPERAPSATEPPSPAAVVPALTPPAVPTAPAAVAPAPTPPAVAAAATAQALPPRESPVKAAPRPAPAVDEGMPLSPLDATALSELELAEQALRAGKGDDAVFRARRSLNVQRSGQALSALVRAHCSQRDLSNAMAQYPNVPRALQGACRQWCARFDINPAER